MTAIQIIETGKLCNIEDFYYNNLKYETGIDTIGLDFRVILTPWSVIPLAAYCEPIWTAYWKKRAENGIELRSIYELRFVL